MISCNNFYKNKLNISAQCGLAVLTVTNRTQVLTSPGYPNNYPPNLRCTWKLISPEQKRFDLHLVDLDIENADNCANDKLGMTDSAVSGLHSKMYLIFHKKSIEKKK